MEGCWRKGEGLLGEMGRVVGGEVEGVRNRNERRRDGEGEEMGRIKQGGEMRRVLEGEIRNVV